MTCRTCGCNSEEVREQAQPAPAFRERALYPVVYMFAATAVLTAILVGLSHSTRTRVEANRQVRFERAVLMAVLPDEVSEQTPPDRIHQMYARRIEPSTTGTHGAYRLMDEGTLVAYALPFEGRGFWDTIRGVIGVTSDKRTVTGLGIHEQNETPGLGAEIVRPRFRGQFRDLPLGQRDTPIAMQPVGQAPTEHEVHAITGATQTSRRLEDMLNAAISEWRRNVGDDRAH